METSPKTIKTGWLLQQPRFRNTLFLAGGYYLLFLFLRILQLLKIPFSGLLVNGFFIFITLALAGCMAYIVRYGSQGRLVKLGWGLLAAAYFFEFLGNIADAVNSAVAQGTFGNLAYLLSISLRGVGIAFLPYIFTPGGNHFRLRVDVRLIVVGLLVMTWAFILIPTIQQGAEDYTPAFAMLDFIMCFAVLDLLIRQQTPQQRITALLFAAATALEIVAQITTVNSAETRFSWLSFLQDGMWMMGYLAVGMAAVIQTIRQPVEEASSSASGFSKPSFYLPSLWALGVYLLFIYSYSHQDQVSFQVLAWAMGGLVAVLVIRQVEALQENARLYQAAQQEIAGRKAAEDRLNYDAHHDSLTGLPNRAYFIDQLHRSMEHLKRHPHHLSAVLFLDLDRFKVINDSFGHSHGDQVLVAVGNRLKSCIRPTDMVSRFGGDEFAILVEDIQEIYEAIHIAERIQEKFSQPIDLVLQKVHTSASIGITLVESSYSQPEDVLRDADSAMYSAKRNGKARYEIFSPELHTLNQEVLQIESDMRQAIQEQQFLVLYQPIMDLSNRKITGAEALLRWQHPRLGLLKPSEFIQVAEDSGLILPIGDWVLREACAQAVRWQKEGRKAFKMSVNLSLRQFHDPFLPRLVQRALDLTGLAPQLLELEISERVVFYNLEGTVKVLRELSKLEIRTAVELFDADYDLLNSLKSTSLSTLKVKQVVSSDAQPDTTLDTSLIRTVVSMAHALDLNVVAERVETPAQLKQLESGMFDRAQGYAISPPVRESEFGRFIMEEPLPA